MKRTLSCFIALFFCSSSFAQSVTLWCEGSIEGNNGFGKQVQGQVSTTVEFNESKNFFAIKDTSNLERFSEYPFKKLYFFDSEIMWDTTLIDFLAKGTFSGSINRKTGEMNTRYFGILPNGAIVTINGKLMCSKQKDNKF
jgi:hypothetical protein